jgi:hypothetical protein
MEDQSDGPNGSLHGLAKPPTNRENPREKTKLLELANKIKEQVTEIQNYLEESNQPNPSFTSTDEPVNYDGIDDIRAEALHNLMELQELLYTPKELLHSQNVSLHNTLRKGKRILTFPGNKLHFPALDRPLPHLSPGATHRQYHL